MLDKDTQKMFEEIGVEEYEEADEQPGRYKVIFRSRWWWYNWFGRKMRRWTSFWGTEANTYGIKTHNASFNTRISGATNRVFAKWNCPSESHRRKNSKLGINERVSKINRYNKFYVNKRMSVFNPKQ